MDLLKVLFCILLAYLVLANKKVVAVLEGITNIIFGSVICIVCIGLTALFLYALLFAQ